MIQDRLLRAILPDVLIDNFDVNNCRIVSKVMLRFIFAVILLLSLVSCGRSVDAPSENSSGLRTLDALVLDNSANFSRALAVADSLSAVAVSLVGKAGEAQAHLNAAEAYSDIDLHRALDHSLRAVRSVRNHRSDADVLNRCLMKLASLYNTQGYMTKEAAEIFESLVPADMSDSSLVKYYVLGVQLYNTLSRQSIDGTLSKGYAARALALRDSVLSVDPGRVTVAANRFLVDGNPEAAEEVLTGRLSLVGHDSPEAASLYYNLAQVCLAENKEDEAETSLIAAAISDLSRGVRNYRALPQLAMLLLDKGDVDRAYRYISRSAADAADSHFSKRQIEMANSISIIDRAYMERRHHHDMMVTVITIIIICAAAGALIAFMIVRTKNRQLHESARALSRSNERLRDVNRSMKVLNARLAEESRVKEQYITSFMELCLSYLRKMEAFRAELGKIAAKGSLAPVVRAINSSRYVNREIAEFFENFDRAFLSLYPDFVDNLNSLLREGERYSPVERFSTEFRVYALVWLGITESGEIARFLRCSESTVYNYRTQMRNRAVSRDTFETDILALSSLGKGGRLSTELML